MVGLAPKREQCKTLGLGKGGVAKAGIAAEIPSEIPWQPLV